MNWVYTLILVTVMATVAPVISKCAISYIDPLKASLIEGLFVLITVTTVFVFINGLKVNLKDFESILLPALAGICWGIFTVGIYFMFSQGAPAGLSMSLLRSISTAGVFVIGYFFLKENATMIHWVGLCFIVSGIYFITQ